MAQYVNAMALLLPFYPPPTLSITMLKTCRKPVDKPINKSRGAAPDVAAD